MIWWEERGGGRVYMATVVEDERKQCVVALAISKHVVATPRLRRTHVDTNPLLDFPWLHVT